MTPKVREEIICRAARILAMQGAERAVKYLESVTRHPASHHAAPKAGAEND